MTNKPPQHAASHQSAAPRRRRKQAHLILGDPAEFHEALRLVEEPPAPPHPAQEPVDVGRLPADVQAALALGPQVVQPVLAAVESLLSERGALWQQLERVTRNAARGADAADGAAGSRDQRNLAAHAKLEMHWAKQAVQLGAQSGKQPEDVTLTRAFQFRRKREKLDHIFKSKPVFERVTGPTFWQISLRNAFSRYIPVGHEFSGLFTEISEKPPELLNAPLEIFGKPHAFDPARSATAQALSESLGLHTRKLLRTQEQKGRAWMQGSYLEEVERKYSQSMQRMLPHVPETDELAVVGQSMAARLQAQAEAPITLADVLERLWKLDREAHAMVLQLQHQQQLAAEAAAAEEVAKAEAAAASAAAALGPQGPALALSTHRCLLDCHHAGSASGALTLRCTGTAAVYFSWARARPRFPFPHMQADEESPFVLAEQSGAILPGQQRTFHVLFRPRRPGMFTERWQLRTRPADVQLPGGTEVVVRGTATTHDTHVLQRSVMQRRLEGEERRRRVAAALEHVLRGVDAPAAATAPLSADGWAEQDRFAAGTLSLERPVYYRPGISQALEEVFADMHAALVLPPDPKKKLKKGEEPPAPAMPDAFDGRVDSLLSYADKLEGLEGERPGAASQAQGFRDRITAALQECALPDRQSVVHARVFRKLLVELADKLDQAGQDAMAAAVESEAARRLAEDADAPQEAEASKPAPAVADSKAKAGKNASVPVEPPAPAFSKDEYSAALEAAFKQRLRQALGVAERSVTRELEHVGAVLDERIAASQASLQVAISEGAAEAEAAHAWDTFALLRKRADLHVPTAPARLAVPPTKLAAAL